MHLDIYRPMNVDNVGKISFLVRTYSRLYASSALANENDSYQSNCEIIYFKRCVFEGLAVNSNDQRRMVEPGRAARLLWLGYANHG
jgi:hypothetical protein